MDEGGTQTNGPEDKKAMIMHKALRQRDVIDRLHVSRKEGKRGLASTEDYVEASIRGIKEYIKKSKEKLITTTSSSTDNIRINNTKN